MIPMALEHLRLFRLPNTAATPGGGDGSSLLFQRCAADYHKQKEQSLCLGIRRKCRKTKLCVHNLLVRALSIQGFINILFVLGSTTRTVWKGWPAGDPSTPETKTLRDNSSIRQRSPRKKSPFVCFGGGRRIAR